MNDMERECWENAMERHNCLGLEVTTVGYSCPHCDKFCGECLVLNACGEYFTMLRRRFRRGFIRNKLNIDDWHLIISQIINQ